jgi:uncharacterized integral membrane protein (TIGR00698 family)
VRQATLPAGWGRLGQGALALAPGLAAALTVAAAANFVAIAYGGPVMLMALLIGLALNFLSASPAAQPGLRAASKPVLQIGVALLGLRISVEDVTRLGIDTVVLIVAGVAVAMITGVVIARVLRQRLAFGLLAGGATGICGASAALAIATVLPRTPTSERETAFVIVTVTTYSTIAMVIYPVLAHWLGFDDHTTGLLLGATIHDVAQVVGAGYAVSPEAGDTATIVKLFRVAMLLPTVFLISSLGSRFGALRPAGRVAPLPPFVVAFALLVGVNSLHLLPAAVSAPASEFSRWCLLVAVASIGIRTSIPDMLRMGRASLAVPGGATLVLLALVATVLSLR